MQNTEYLTREIAVQHSGLALRRLNEHAAAGRIRRRKIKDPVSGRKQWVYLLADIERWRMEALKEKLPAAIGAPGARSLPAAVPDCQWLTIDQAEAYTGLPASYLQQLIQKRQLKARDVGVRPGGRWRVARVALDKLAL